MATSTIAPHVRIDHSIVDNLAAQIGIYGLGIYVAIKRHLNTKDSVYRSTVFWTHSATKSCCRSQQTALLMSDLGGRFVSMPSNQPGLIVSTLKLA
jgi:hypothetical protein